MTSLSFFSIAGIVFGIATAIYYVSSQIKESNNIGDSKAEPRVYTHSFTSMIEKNDVRASYDLDQFDNFYLDNPPS